MRSGRAPPGGSVKDDNGAWRREEGVGQTRAGEV